MDSAETRARTIELFDAGLAMSRELVDREIPQGGSPLRLLAANAPMIGPGHWVADDFVFLAQALRGLIGVECAQLDGLSQLLALSDWPLLLHPALTLIRGMAEACGTVTWILEPWIAPLGTSADISATQWAELSAPILARSQLVLIETLHDRKRRHDAENRPDQVEKDDERIDQEVARVTSQHAPGQVVLTGDRRGWGVGGQARPSITDKVRRATEYAYGQRYVGTGMNPYPMLSGYAHASLDVVFAYSAERLPITQLLAAPDEEVKLIASLALRFHSSIFDLAGKAFGVGMTEFTEWDAKVEEFVLSS